VCQATQCQQEGAINWNRIIGGGLLAGLVFNVGEFVIEPLMGAQMQDFFKRLGLPVPSESAMAALAVAAFMLGIVSVWLYAAIRPRYGAGVRTATTAGVAVWALSCLFPNVAMYAFGLIASARLFWLWTLWPLVESVAATIAGAWIYREGPSIASSASAARA
jgi:hypothetical protein